MAKSWFPIQNSLIDRQDLTVYEKMCSIVMARYADKAEFEHLLTLEAISKKIGCSKKETEKALLGLIQKGLLNLEDSGSEHILHHAGEEVAQTAVFESIEVETLELQQDPQPVLKAHSKPEKKKVKENKESIDELSQQLYELLDEKINAREARIILNFGNNDLERIAYCYGRVKSSGAQDVVEALLDALQREEETIVAPIMNETKIADQIKREMPEPRIGGQINLVNINKMKLYKEMASKTKKTSK